MRKKKGRSIYGYSPRLGVREIGSAVHGGMSGLGWEIVRDKVDSGVVNASVGPSEIPHQRQATVASAAVVQTEIDETAKELPELKADLEKKKPRKLTALQALERVRADMPAGNLSLKFLLAFGFTLCVGEVGNSTWALGDAIGIDVTGQMTDVSPLSIGIVVSTSLVVTIVNAVAGTFAISLHSPLRRLAGWVLLFFIAFVLSGIRLAIAGDASIWLMLLSFAISLLAGLAAGYAHRALTAALEIRHAYRARVRAAEEAIAVAEADVAKTEAAIGAATARRRNLATEADALATAPERERAAGEDLAGFREARRRQARYWYEMGRRLAGKDKAATGEENGHA
jgi:hypothetical protein